MLLITCQVFIPMKHNKCLMCEGVRSSASVLCTDCSALYGPYTNERWFLELCALQKKQYQIDRIESAAYTDTHWKHSMMTYYGPNKKRGRPRRTDTVEAFIRAVYQPGISIRKLTAYCISHGLEVSRETVRSIIQKINDDK